MIKKNIVYKTKQLEKFYSKNRVKWSQFYTSEKKIINLLNLKNERVLDLGCACGGLGMVLKKKFNNRNYVGVEINKRSARKAKSLNTASQIFNCDLINLRKFLKEKFKFVFAFSVIDWNISYKLMLKKAWTFVSEGGALICTFRITNFKSCFNIKKSYQYINFNGQHKGEKAPYIVFNSKELIKKLVKLGCSDITAFGYWGKPSLTAVTPYKKIFFAAFLLKKKRKKKLKLNLPKEIF